MTLKTGVMSGENKALPSHEKSMFELKKYIFNCNNLYNYNFFQYYHIFFQMHAFMLDIQKIKHTDYKHLNGSI